MKVIHNSNISTTNAQKLKVEKKVKLLIWIHKTITTDFQLANIKFSMVPCSAIHSE